MPWCTIDAEKHMALACPRCGLKNPSTARQCDCGHRFLDDVAEQRSASPSPSREARHCDNCGRALGALETGIAYGTHVVCGQCKAILVAEKQNLAPTASPATERLASGVLKTTQQATDFTRKYVGTWRQLKVLIIIIVVAPLAVGILAALAYLLHHNS